MINPMSNPIQQLARLRVELGEAIDRMSNRWNDISARNDDIRHSLERLDRLSIAGSSFQRTLAGLDTENLFLKIANANLEADLLEARELLQWAADNDVRFEVMDYGYSCSMYVLKPSKCSAVRPIISGGIVSAEGETPELALAALRKEVEG